MNRNKLRVSELHGKQNNGLLSNRPLKSQDYQQQLKKLPFPVQEFEASDLSSIVSESELKSKEIFDALLSKKSSIRKFVEEPENIVASRTKLEQERKRSSLEPKKGGATAALKSMLNDKVGQGSFFSEIEMLRDTNKKLLQQNSVLKQQLDRLAVQSQSQSRFDSKESQHEPTYESRAPTLHCTSFDEFEKLQQSNRLLRNKLNLSKRNGQPEKLFERPMGNDSSECGRNKEGVSALYTITSIYSKTIMKNRMPELQSFATAVRSYFQEFEDAFLKINIMFESLESPQYDSEKYLQTKQLVSLMKIPVMYKNKPKMVDSLLNVTKSSNRSQSREKCSVAETFSPELLSAEDTLVMLEQMLSKVVRSNNMMRLCRENRQLLGLVSRIRG